VQWHQRSEESHEGSEEALVGLLEVELDDVGRRGPLPHLRKRVAPDSTGDPAAVSYLHAVLLRTQRNLGAVRR